MVPFPQDGPFRVYCMFFDRFFIVRSAPSVISLPPHLALNSPLSLVRHTVAFAVGAR